MTHDPFIVFSVGMVAGVLLHAILMWMVGK